MGPNLVFRGGVRFADTWSAKRTPLCIIVKFCFLPTKFFTKLFWFQTGQTDGRTDAISMFWPAIVWPDFASKVRLGRQGRPAEASGLRPSALASRPPALVLGLPCFKVRNTVILKSVYSLCRPISITGKHVTVDT